MLAKEGINEDTLQIKEKRTSVNYRMNFYGTVIKDNSRKFIKILNGIRRELEEEKLKRVSKLSAIDKRLSYKILNHNEKDKKKDRKFITMKENNSKNFKFKKMINELPVIEKLKVRNEKLYKKDMMCIRCRRKEETLTHLWEC